MSRLLPSPRLWAGWLGLAAALSLTTAIVSCGDAASLCNYDSDCGGDQLCVEGYCAVVCASDDDCHELQTCKAFLRPEESAPVQVCMWDNHGNNGSEAPAQCDNDAECRALLNEATAVCGFDGRCFIPLPADETRSFAFLIRDRSEPSDGDGADDEPIVEPDPDEDDSEQLSIASADWDGLEVFTVFLVDAEGGVVGYGKTLQYQHGTNPEATSHLGGEPIELTADGACVSDVDEAPRTVLGGPDGALLVAFVGADGQAVSVSSTMQVVVIARGPGCGGEEASSREYDAFFCVSEQEEFDVERDCERYVGRGQSPRQQFEVTEQP
jgi:hypothetical protein